MDKPSLDHRKVMRTSAWIWIVYLACMVVVDCFIYRGFLAPPVLLYHLINSIPALLFLGLAYTPWLDKRAGLVTAVMILLISVVPILANHLFSMPLPQAPLSNIEGMVLRQLPILFIGLVLVAWHYRLATMIFFSLGTNAFDLLIVFAMGRFRDPRLEAFYFITVIRTVCFVVVGVFINQLINRLRTQQVALLSANARLIQQAGTLETLATSRERNRMSRELHDTVVHTLSGLTVQLETARAYLKIDPLTAEKQLDQSLAATRDGLQETRRALKALRASPLDDLGLILAIRRLGENAAERGKFNLDLSLPDPSFTLLPEVEQCLFRVAQEAVENVVHHANAHRLSISLEENGDGVELVVQDDGIGFKPDVNLSPGHYGLAGMKERAQLVGARLSINSKPGEGTTVHLSIKGCAG